MRNLLTQRHGCFWYCRHTLFCGSVGCLDICFFFYCTSQADFDIDRQRCSKLAHGQTSRVVQVWRKPDIVTSRSRPGIIYSRRSHTPRPYTSRRRRQNAPTQVSNVDDACLTQHVVEAPVTHRSSGRQLVPQPHIRRSVCLCEVLVIYLPTLLMVLV